MKDNSENKQVRILIVDELKVTRDETVLSLGKENYLLTETVSIESARERLANEYFDLCIISLCKETTIETGTIDDIRQHFPNVELMLLIEAVTESAGLETAFTNISDILVRPFSSARLTTAVCRALNLRQVKQELLQLRQTVAMSFGFDNLVGISKPMLQLKEVACRLAPTEITLLIEGATGTGKEILARTIHHHSKRRQGSFVMVDFSAATEAELAIELFGSEKNPSLPNDPCGKSLLEQAEHGTLFLDEVSEIPESLQARIAGFLQTFRINSTESFSEKKIDVRIIASSSRDLSNLVEQGKFDKDLYRSLNVIPLQMPTLAERIEDIEILIDYFIRRFSWEMKRESFAISRQAIEKLLSYDWPGNVRELENTLRRGAALCQDNLIEAENISFIVFNDQTPSDGRKGNTIVFRRNGLLDDSQRSIITRALDDNSWNFTQTAQELGIGRTTLWRKVKKYRLTKKQPVSST